MDTSCIVRPLVGTVAGRLVCNDDTLRNVARLRSVSVVGYVGSMSELGKAVHTALGSTLGDEELSAMQWEGLWLAMDRPSPDIQQNVPRLVLLLLHDDEHSEKDEASNDGDEGGERARCAHDKTSHHASHNVLRVIMDAVATFVGMCSDSGTYEAPPAFALPISGEDVVPCTGLQWAAWLRGVCDSAGSTSDGQDGNGGNYVHALRRSVAVGCAAAASFALRSYTAALPRPAPHNSITIKSTDADVVTDKAAECKNSDFSMKRPRAGSYISALLSPGWPAVQALRCGADSAALSPLAVPGSEGGNADAESDQVTRALALWPFLDPGSNLSDIDSELPCIDAASLNADLALLCKSTKGGRSGSFDLTVLEQVTQDSSSCSNDVQMTSSGTESASVLGRVNITTLLRLHASARQAAKAQYCNAARAANGYKKDAACSVAVQSDICDGANGASTPTISSLATAFSVCLDRHIDEALATVAAANAASARAAAAAMARQHFTCCVIEGLLVGGVAGARRRFRAAFEKKQQEQQMTPTEGSSGSELAFVANNAELSVLGDDYWGSDDSDLEEEGVSMSGMSQLGDPLAKPLAAMNMLLSSAAAARHNFENELVGDVASATAAGSDVAPENTQRTKGSAVQAVAAAFATLPAECAAAWDAEVYQRLLPEALTTLGTLLQTASKERRQARRDQRQAMTNYRALAEAREALLRQRLSSEQARAIELRASVASMVSATRRADEAALILADGFVATKIGRRGLRHSRKLFWLAGHRKDAAMLCWRSLSREELRAERVARSARQREAKRRQIDKERALKTWQKACKEVAKKRVADATAAKDDGGSAGVVHTTTSIPQPSEVNDSDEGKDVASLHHAKDDLSIASSSIVHVADDVAAIHPIGGFFEVAYARDALARGSVRNAGHDEGASHPPLQSFLHAHQRDRVLLRGAACEAGLGAAAAGGGGIEGWAMRRRAARVARRAAALEAELGHDGGEDAIARAARMGCISDGSSIAQPLDKALSAEEAALLLKPEYDNDLGMGEAALTAVIGRGVHLWIAGAVATGRALEDSDEDEAQDVDESDEDNIDEQNTDTNADISKYDAADIERRRLERENATDTGESVGVSEENNRRWSHGAFRRHVDTVRREQAEARSRARARVHGRGRLLTLEFENSAARDRVLAALRSLVHVQDRDYGRDSEGDPLHMQQGGHHLNSVADAAAESEDLMAGNGRDGSPGDGVATEHASGSAQRGRAVTVCGARVPGAARSTQEARVPRHVFPWETPPASHQPLTSDLTLPGTMPRSHRAATTLATFNAGDVSVNGNGHSDGARLRRGGHRRSLQRRRSSRLREIIHDRLEAEDTTNGVTLPLNLADLRRRHSWSDDRTLTAASLPFSATRNIDTWQQLAAANGAGRPGSINTARRASQADAAVVAVAEAELALLSEPNSPSLASDDCEL